jgi:hypothetical protein
MKAGAQAHLERTREALAPWEADRAFMNLKDRPCDPRTLFGASAGRLLAQIKEQVDPDDAIVANHPVR